MNRASSDRLAQPSRHGAADRASYPAADFEDSWREVLLLEHTCGGGAASATPSACETREQWAVKQSYAAGADRRSATLLTRPVARFGAAPCTAPWTPQHRRLARGGCRPPKHLTEDWSLVEPRRALPSQRLKSGDGRAGGECRPSPRGATPRQGRPPPPARAFTADAGAATTQRVVSLRLDRIPRHRRTAPRRARRNSRTPQRPVAQPVLTSPQDPAVQGLRDGGPHSLGEPGPLSRRSCRGRRPRMPQLVTEIRLVAGRTPSRSSNTRQGAPRRPQLPRQAGKVASTSASPSPSPRQSASRALRRRGPDDTISPRPARTGITVGPLGDVSNDAYGVTWDTHDAPSSCRRAHGHLLNSQTKPPRLAERGRPRAAAPTLGDQQPLGHKPAPSRRAPTSSLPPPPPTRPTTPPAAASPLRGQPLLPMPPPGETPAVPPVQLTGTTSSSPPKAGDDGKALSTASVTPP
jgi:hypothetical protein